MGLQPQNLAFGTTNTNTTSNNDKKYNTKDCFVASVMDWEEACYADPRFEILLICRKVLANKDQADELWRTYARQVKQVAGNLDEGPLEPWLKLETVRSLLQAVMDLIAGGYNHAENDLLLKIDREKQRMYNM